MTAINTDAQTVSNSNTNDMVKNLNLYLLPEEITIEEIGDRATDLDPAADEAKIAEMADTIRVVGQEMPVKIFERSGDNVAFMGRRRIAAIALINAAQKKGEVPMRVWCVIDNTPGDTFRKAVHENIHRKNYSPVEMGRIIAKLRAKEGWNGGKATKKVADYLGVSVATVTQAERILTLPVDKLAQVHSGELSANSAFELLDIKPEKRDEVLAKAKELQKQEADAKPVKAGKVDGKADGKANGKADGKADSKVVEPEAESSDKGVVKARHIREAARKVEDSQLKVKPLSRGELLSFFETIRDSPTYGHLNSPVRSWAAYCLDRWAIGKGSDKTMLDKFDNLVMDDDTLYTGEGTPSKAELARQAEEDERAAAKDSKPAKPAAKSAAKPKKK